MTPASALDYLTDYSRGIHWLTIEGVDIARAEVARLRAVDAGAATAHALILRVLADEESRPGGWGPDVTCVAMLRQAGGALEAKP